MNDTSEITIYGTNWCGGSRRARLLFEQHHIPYRWVDIDADKEAAKYIEGFSNGCQSVPTITWPDGTTLVEPTLEELEKILGTQAAS